MMPYLFVANTHGACAYTQIFKRQCERQATKLSLVARVVAPCSFTPLCKAFDSLDRGIVLWKLHHNGLRGTILEWHRSYFIGRRQKAKVNQCSLETRFLGVVIHECQLQSKHSPSRNASRKRVNSTIQD